MFVFLLLEVFEFTFLIVFGLDEEDFFDVEETGLLFTFFEVLFLVLEVLVEELFFGFLLVFLFSEVETLFDFVVFWSELLDKFL